MLGRALVIAAALLVPAAGAAQRRGVICIAPFHADTSHLPRMSETTWGPSPGSKFVFRVGKRIRQSVAEGAAVMIRDVPADRKVLVQVELDGRPFESFWLDLRKDKRICLWLYPGYWHWIEGCRCAAR